MHSEYIFMIFVLPPIWQPPHHLLVLCPGHFVPGGGSGQVVTESNIYDICQSVLLTNSAPIVDGYLLSSPDSLSGGDTADHSKPRMTEQIRLAVRREAVTHLRKYLRTSLMFSGKYIPCVPAWQSSWPCWSWVPGYQCPGSHPATSCKGLAAPSHPPTSPSMIRTVWIVRSSRITLSPL